MFDQSHRRVHLKTQCTCIHLCVLVIVQKDNDAELVKRAREGMTGEEAQFSVEVPVEQQALIWSDKYRPRKPRFFNRVHTVSEGVSGEGYYWHGHSVLE